eukprot:g3847.t1
MHISPHLKADFEKTLQHPGIAVAVAAIKALTGVIKRSRASTMMGLQIELRSASEQLIDLMKYYQSVAKIEKTTISMKAACELFLRHVTRTFLDQQDFDNTKLLLIQRGENFAKASHRSRHMVAKHGESFLRNGNIVLVHGYSNVVLELLLKAAKKRHFNVVVTEGRPGRTGVRMAERLLKEDIPTTIVLDSAVGYIMEKVHLVLCGAEGVVENGGIVNQVGTFQLAIVAKSFNKPFYVASESYKFARLFPLSQLDLPENVSSTQIDVDIPSEKGAVQVDNRALLLKRLLVQDNPKCDYTPPRYITLLFTDIGVLTPSAVSDELIKLYA